MRHSVALALIFPVVACSRQSGPPAVVAPVPQASPAVAVRPVPGNITTDELLRTLSLREKVGQLIMPWLLGNYTALDAAGFDTAASWVDSFAVGGIIISIGSPLDVAAKLNALQQRSRLPLLIAADLEAGSATRLTGGTAFPTAMAIGATASELDAYQMGRVTALEARAVGIHLTFSPVADVNNNPANPIINTRSFGEDPKESGRLVAAYVRGASEHGLYTTAKHFPGHGDTGTDSHIDVPVLPACWDRLNSLELVPFRATIKAGVTAVMTAHIALPCLSGGEPLPATLSGEVMTGILRDSLGFRGLVVTDALTMGAIIRRFGAGESAVRAFLAGSDLLLMPTDNAQAVDAMIAAVEAGRISPQRLDSSVRRILDLKQEAGLFRQRTVNLDSVGSVVGRRDFQTITDDIAARALTLLQPGPIDTFRATRGRVAVITYAEETNLSFANVLLRELRVLGDSVSTFRLYPASGPLSYDSARAVIAASPRTIFASSVRPIAWRGHVALPDSLAGLITSSTRRSTMLVSFGSPYLLDQLPGYTGGYLLAWGPASASERAVGRALASGAAISGHLPITVGATFPRGFGLEREAR